MNNQEYVEISIEELQSEMKKIKDSIFLHQREMNRYEDKIDMEIQYRGHSPRMEEFEKKCQELEASIKGEKQKLDKIMELLKFKMDREVLKEKIQKLEVRAYDLDIAEDEREALVGELIDLSDDVNALNIKIAEEEQTEFFSKMKRG